MKSGLCKGITNFMSHRLLLLFLIISFYVPTMQVIVVDANKGVEEMEEEFRRQEEHILGQNKENSEKPAMGKRLSEEASASTKRLMEEEAGNPTSRQKLRLLGQEF